jgi:hypothetical protein
LTDDPGVQLASVPSGVYRIPAAVPIPAIRSAAERGGFRMVEIDGAAVADKIGFLAALGQALSFPAYSAANWDACEESLRDLTWLPAKGYVVVYDDPRPFVRGDPEEWAIARDVLGAAAAFWGDRGVTMLVLLRCAGSSVPDVPWLAGARHGSGRGRAPVGGAPEST